MKPTKNRHYCIDANKPKMLFENEKKANNFIKFNAEEILLNEGKAPNRTYFCISCGGWHVTSISGIFLKKSKVQKYFDDIEFKKKAEEIEKENIRLLRLKEIEKAKEENKALIKKAQQEFSVLNNLEFNNMQCEIMQLKTVNDVNILTDAINSICERLMTAKMTLKQRKSLVKQIEKYLVQPNEI